MYDKEKISLNQVKQWRWPDCISSHLPQIFVVCLNRSTHWSCCDEPDLNQVKQWRWEQWARIRLYLFPLTPAIMDWNWSIRLVGACWSLVRFSSSWFRFMMTSHSSMAQKIMPPGCICLYFSMALFVMRSCCLECAVTRLKVRARWHKSVFIVSTYPGPKNLGIYTHNWKRIHFVRRIAELIGKVLELYLH